MIEFIKELVKNLNFGAILSLLLVFQWYSQHAKEQTIKNSLFSIRRIIDRAKELESPDSLKEKARDLVDVLDATLATIGARHPFTKNLEKIIDRIVDRFRHDSEKELTEPHQTREN